MKRMLAVWFASIVSLSLIVTGFSLAAGDDDDDDERKFRARLSGFEETPQSLSSPGTGRFVARLTDGGTTLTYTLTYSGLPTVVSAAHIHLGQRGTTGGVSAFLCGGGDKPACPSPGGTVTGVIDAADVIGPAGQGIAAGEFNELVRAMRAGFTYVNVHTTQFPGGEIRGQINANDD